MDRGALLRAAVLSGLPSTGWAVFRRDDLLAATRAAGSLLLPAERLHSPLLAAGLTAHIALSVGWAVVLDAALPAHRRVAWGALAGLAIAALDLGLAHASSAPRFAPVSELPVWPQVADHVAFGALIGFGRPVACGHAGGWLSLGQARGRRAPGAW